MKNRLVYILGFILVLSSCVFNNEEGLNQSDRSRVTNNQYSKGFSIEEHSWGNVLNVYNPWQGADVSYSYALTKQDLQPESIFFDEIISTPISRAVCLSTTHIAYLSRVGADSVIAGVSGANFISNKNVRERVGKGLVRDVGYEQSINFELLLSLKPDVVFTYGVGAEMAGYLQKLKDLKIPVVFIGDYLEETPLGKAEWLKAFGLFVDAAKVADSIFTGIEDEYLMALSLVHAVEDKPKVFLNLPWKDVWFFPGNEGYLARLIKDAKGDYVMSHLNGSQSYPHSIEAALNYASQAQVWLNTGSTQSINELKSEFPLANRFPMVKNGSVYNNNRMVNEHGGNDFWESGVVYPQIILRDLIKIFHPDVIDHELVYYQKLE